MGVRRENDGVAGLQCQQHLINGGGSGVGGGGDGGDDAFWRSNAHGAEGLVFLDHAAGLLIAHIIPYMLGGVLILSNLIHHDTVTGLLTSHLGQRNAHFGHGHGGFFTDGIYLFLAKCAVELLCFTDNGERLFQCFNRVDRQRGRHSSCPPFL